MDQGGEMAKGALMASEENHSDSGPGTLLVDLRVGDRFVFDGHMLTVAEAPQDVWGIVEVVVEEWDFPFMGSSTRSTVRVTQRNDVGSP